MMMAQTQAVHLDCITAPHDGLNPSVILTASRVQGSPLTAQYVFNVPDAVSRFCLEHKLRPGLGLRGVFVTGTGHELHGLPGLVMRLRGDGHGAFELFGPGWRDGTQMGKGLAPSEHGPVHGYVRAMPNVCSWKAPAVLVSEFSRGESGLLYEDEHVRVWPMWGAAGEEGWDEDGDAEHASADPRAPSLLSRADILEQLRSLAPPRGAKTHVVFGRRYLKSCDVTYGDVWVRKNRGAGGAGESQSTVRVGVQDGVVLLGYACYVKRADQLVVVSGYADDVSRRFDVLRRHWLVRHCADRLGIGGCSAGERRRVSVTIVVSGCVRNVPSTSYVRDGVAPGSPIREIRLPVIGRETHPNIGVLGFDSTAKTAARLHLLCPHTFPAPYAWKYLREEADQVGPDRQPQSGAFRVTLGGGTAVEGVEGEEGEYQENVSALYTPYVSSSRISSTTELQDQCQKAALFLDALEDDERSALTALRKKVQDESTSRRMLQISTCHAGSASAPSTTTNQSAATNLRQRLLGGGVSKRKRDGAEELSPPETAPTAPSKASGMGEHKAVTAADLVAPHVLFLGTGSAEPSKYRGPSGILVKIPYMDDDYLLMECGEGTFGQLVRMFGYTGALDRLSKLRCVWISHRHADHISGLVELLSQRAKCMHVKESELLVLGPKACVRWVRSLQPIINLGRLRVEHFGAAHDSPVCRQVQRRIGTKMIFTPVHHCHDSFAVSFVFGGCDQAGRPRPQQFKLVYSGDTEPCEALVRDSHGADMIIHEATFENEMVRDARAKRHSTIQEALDVARRAGAARVILTHFSQRYPKFPKLDYHELERSGVGVAFDGFAIPLEATELSKLTQFVRDFFDS